MYSKNWREKRVRLILNDGTIIENGRAGYSMGFLWLRLPGFTMQAAADIAFNPALTQRIVFQYGQMEDVYEGYTSCTSINNEDSMISVCLVKG